VPTKLGNKPRCERRLRSVVVDRRGDRRSAGGVSTEREQKRKRRELPLLIHLNPPSHDSGSSIDETSIGLKLPHMTATHISGGASCFVYPWFLLSLLLSTTYGGGPGGGSGRGFGRGPIGDYKCYQVCPPIVYPTGHDPYYETPYYQSERELHGGPFGPGTLNPYNPSDPKNYAGHWPGIKRQVPTRSLPQSYPDNFSGAGRSLLFLQLQSTARETSMLSSNMKANMGTQATLSAYSTLRAKQLHKNLMHQSVSLKQKTHPKGVMCLHVCPKTPTARPDDEPFGGPFGPDPYYFRGKTMFNNKKGHSGFSSSSSNFRNHQNEAVRSVLVVCIFFSITSVRSSVHSGPQN
jgi:hypothetical protein